jgi:hypothetical protein
LIERYQSLLTPAEVGLVLGVNIPTSLMTYVSKEAAAALNVYFVAEGHKRMAKAILRN